MKNPTIYYKAIRPDGKAFHVEEREHRYRAKADRIISEDFSASEHEAQTGTKWPRP